MIPTGGACDVTLVAVLGLVGLGVLVTLILGMTIRLLWRRG
jgi:hypothetical protein